MIRYDLGCISGVCIVIEVIHLVLEFFKEQIDRSLIFSYKPTSPQDPQQDQPPIEYTKYKQASLNVPFPFALSIFISFTSESQVESFDYQEYMMMGREYWQRNYKLLVVIEDFLVVMEVIVNALISEVVNQVVEGQILMVLICGNQGLVSIVFVNIHLFVFLLVIFCDHGMRASKNMDLESMIISTLLLEITF